MGCSGFVSCTSHISMEKFFFLKISHGRSPSTAFPRLLNAGILATIDQDFGVTDKRAFLHFVWTDVLKRDEESFELVCPQKGPPKGQTPAADGEDLVDGDDK